jgi:hypothetical protein
MGALDFILAGMEDGEGMKLYLDFVLGIGEQPELVWAQLELSSGTSHYGWAFNC